MDCDSEDQIAICLKIESITKLGSLQEVFTLALA